MNKRKPDFSERDALKHVEITIETFQDALRRIQIFDVAGSVTPEDMESIARNSDVSNWLSKVGNSSREPYKKGLCYFTKCVCISPSALLDLKLTDDPKRRYFPVEKLIETWIAMAEKHGLSDCKILFIVTLVRSFFKHNRIPLLKIECSYTPASKEPLEEDQLRRFREALDFYGKILFDFLLSVPLRDGQFQICPHCRKDFFPKWRNITTYPRIEPYSPFLIKPHKGHENKKYRRTMQVAYLTKTAAASLNTLRDVKEAALGRPLRSDEYIITHYLPRYGIEHITPFDYSSIQWCFKSAELKTEIHLTPHFLRSWDNSILAAQGIDKQLRDLFLGHLCAYEMNYIIQLIPRWQQTFRDAKALEALDFVASTNEKKDESGAKSALSDEDYELLRNLLKKVRDGRLNL